jgi:hypothetical protein
MHSHIKSTATNTISTSDFKNFYSSNRFLQDWKTERYKEIIKSGTVSAMSGLFPEPTLSNTHNYIYTHNR